MMGPGSSWLNFHTSLIDACRTAGLHVVANSLAAGKKPTFKEPEIEELQASITKETIMLRDIDSREKKMLAEAPWTSVMVTRLQTEYRDALTLSLAPFRQALPPSTWPEFDNLFAEMIIYFREPSSIMSRIYDQHLKRLCAEHSVTLPDFSFIKSPCGSRRSAFSRSVRFRSKWILIC